MRGVTEWVVNGPHKMFHTVAGVRHLGRVRPCLYGEKLAQGPLAPSPRASRGEPSFPTIAYKSSSTVYMRNCKPGSGGRVTLGVGSLGWRDRVTLGGEPTFSHVNGFKRVNSPSRAKSHHFSPYKQRLREGSSDRRTSHRMSPGPFDSSRS